MTSGSHSSDKELPSHFQNRKERNHDRFPESNYIPTFTQNRSMLVDNEKDDISGKSIYEI